MFVPKFKSERDFINYIKRHISSSSTSNKIFRTSTYDDLPPAEENKGKMHYILNSQGTSWLPGDLGGIYRAKGFYLSDGISWSFIGSSPIVATQDEVLTGTNKESYVSPSTLATWWEDTKDELPSSPGGISTPPVAVKLARVAGATINGGKAVMQDPDGEIYPFDIENPFHYGKYLGVAETAATIGNEATIIISGVSNYIGSGWSAGISYYIGSNGLLTHIPPTTGLLIRVGVGIDTDKIAIIPNINVIQNG